MVVVDTPPDGPTLYDCLELEPVLEDRLQTVWLLLAITDVVAFAHARGVIHRKLTPHGIIIAPAGAAIESWMSARRIGDDQAEPPRDREVTGASGIVSTAAYLPPEQAVGGPLDATCDVYALGAVLYHVVANHPPYRGTTEHVLALIAAGPPPPIERVVQRVPHVLASIIRRAMAPDPTARYPHAAALAMDLRAYLGSEHLEARAAVSRARRDEQVS